MYIYIYICIYIHIYIYISRFPSSSISPSLPLSRHGYNMCTYVYVCKSSCIQDHQRSHTCLSHTSTLVRAEILFVYISKREVNGSRGGANSPQSRLLQLQLKAPPSPENLVRRPHSSCSESVLKFLLPELCRSERTMAGKANKKPEAEQSRGRPREKKEKKDKKEKTQAPKKTEESKAKRKAQSSDMQSGKQSKPAGATDAGPPPKRLCFKTTPAVTVDAERASSATSRGSKASKEISDVRAPARKEKKQKKDKTTKPDQADKEKEKKEKSSKDPIETPKSILKNPQGGDSCAKNLLDTFEQASPEEKQKRQQEVEDLLAQMEDSESGSDGSSDGDAVAEPEQNAPEEISSLGSDEDSSSESDSSSSSDDGDDEEEEEEKEDKKSMTQAPPTPATVATQAEAEITSAAQTAAEVTIRNSNLDSIVS